MKFSLEPFPGDTGFTQWRDAMKMVARLPGGIPTEFRKQLWLTLADRYIVYRQLDWPATCRSCLNERTNPDDDALGVQIVKDLHRTGCSHLAGDNEAAEQNQALLKRVLLAYARFNKHVGYCQGFNLLAALVLQVVEWNEEDALKMMLYLIEGVLPDGYFANDLRGLSVDMAVFRDLLRLRLAVLAKHLDKLQLEANDGSAGSSNSSYEPPLTNVFTMQWFLTLFSTCLPPASVLRIWDLTLLEGNEVLLRTALAIWDGLADRIMAVDSADEFYSIMGVLTREMLEFGLMDCNELVQTIVSMAPFPFPQLQELREKYTFDIRPFAHSSAAGGSNTHRKSSIRDFVGLRLFYTDEDDDGELDEDQLALASAAWYLNQRHGRANVTLDIGTLKRQYSKLRDRQRQAHVILTSTLKTAIEQQAHPDSARAQPRPPSRARLPVNSLLAGHKPIVRKVRPTPKVQFTMPPDEASRESNRPRGPRAMRTKIMIDERTDTHKQPQQQEQQQTQYPAHQQQKLTRQGANPSPHRGETLTWEQIERERRERRADSSCMRTRSWSSSSDDSSSTSLCDQGLHDAEGESSSLCVSPIPPASPRSPRLPPSPASLGAVFQTPPTAGYPTSPTRLTRSKNNHDISCGSAGDRRATAIDRDVGRTQQPDKQREQQPPMETVCENRPVTSHPTEANVPSSSTKTISEENPAGEPEAVAAEIVPRDCETVATTTTSSGKGIDESETSETGDIAEAMLPRTETSALNVAADATITPTSGGLIRPTAQGSPDSREVEAEHSAPSKGSLCSDIGQVSDGRRTKDAESDPSPSRTTSCLRSTGSGSSSTTASVNRKPPSGSTRRLIIADAPRRWTSLSEENDSPSAIAAAPQMWHQIPEGPFVEEGDESDPTEVISQSASGVSGVRAIKTQAETPPSLDELLERYTKMTHLVEDASARLVASTSIDSGESRTPPSRADSPPVAPFNPFPTQRTTTLDTQVARRLGLYSNH